MPKRFRIVTEPAAGDALQRYRHHLFDVLDRGIEHVALTPTAQVPGWMVTVRDWLEETRP